MRFWAITFLGADHKFCGKRWFTISASVAAIIFMLALACGPKISPADKQAREKQAAIAAMSRGDYENAIKHFRRAGVPDQATAPMSRNMAVCFENLGLTDSAIVYYEEAIVLNPKDADAYERIGHIFYERGDSHEAMTWYDRGSEVGPLSALGFTRLGQIYQRWREYDRALGYYHRAIAVDSLYPAANYGLATVSLAMGDTAAAVVHLQKCVDEKGYAIVAYQLGLIEFRGGNHEQAAYWMRRYVEIEPTSDLVPQAKEYLRRINAGQQGH